MSAKQMRSRTSLLFASFFCGILTDQGFIACCSSTASLEAFDIAGTKATLLARINRRRAEEDPSYAQQLQDLSKAEEAAETVAEQRYEKSLEVLNVAELKDLLRAVGVHGGERSCPLSLYFLYSLFSSRSDICQSRSF